MKLSEFAKYKIEFDAKARARKIERLNLGLFDLSWSEQVIEEMLMDITERVKALEAILNPPPE